jgi:DNA-binding response OmpR family regulator
MRHSKSTVTVLVVGSVYLRSNLRDALAETNCDLLHAATKDEALELLELLRSEISLAIVELELADYDGWKLIRYITCQPDKPVRIIATTSTYPELFSRGVKDFGVDAVVPKLMPPESWLRTIEAVLKTKKRPTNRQDFSYADCPSASR